MTNTITLTTDQSASLAYVLRAVIRREGNLTVTIRRYADPELFDRLLDTMPDADVLGYVGGLKLAPTYQEPTPIAVHEPAPEPREKASLTAEWVADGRTLYLAGKPRPDATDGSRKAKHMGFGWDHAKAEAEARLAVPGQEQADIEDALAVDIGDA